MNTDSLYLAPCPHCGSDVKIVDIQNGFAIVCTDKNCLGQMRIQYGSCDDQKLFLNKLVTDWNKRQLESVAIRAAIDNVSKYRELLYDEMQEEYDEHCSCCLDTLDDVINRLVCYTAGNIVDPRAGRIRELEKKLEEANGKLERVYHVIGEIVEKPNPFEKGDIYEQIRL